MSRGNHQFSSVKSEGGLLPQDILARIQSGDPELEGTKAETYHLGAHERIGEAANQAWSRLVSSWRAFQEALAKEPEDAPATGLTRDRWLLPLFEILGYGRLPKGTAIEVEGKSYAVSHTWHHSPIHLLGCRVDLDTRQKGVAGAAMSSPHGLVQDFLNRSDAHLWGFVTNGYQLRVLRDHHSLTRQAYVEFDLQAIMDGEQYSEFLLLWLVCHQSRVEEDKPEECWLETWVNISRDEGVRALDKLRDGVEKAIEAFGTGYLAHKANTRLRAALESRELDSQEYYRQILRLVYRLIFLFVAEERDALLDPNATEAARDRYLRYYATRRIRDLADKRRGSPHGDLWRGIALVMEKLDDGYPELGLPALGSMLWGEDACPWLMDAECANDHVLKAVRLLSHIHDGKTRYPVNWRNVGADELGSIYEGLLELHPRMNKEAGNFELDTAAGHERKTTGSYYTHTSLVDCLLDSALDPVLDEAAKATASEQAILRLKVCDPACGSGHFLVAAARRIAKRLASVRSGDDEPSPKEVQAALRDVIGHCIFGVDLNPMAVELCKVSLWMEAIEPGKPLSFLDSHVQCGNALLGATPALMGRGIPDVAFNTIDGDDKAVAKRLKAHNRNVRRAAAAGQETLFDLFAVDGISVAAQAEEVESTPDDDIDAIREKERRWNQLIRSSELREAMFRADAWCAAFVWPKQEGAFENGAITDDAWRRLQEDVSSASEQTRKIVRSLASDHRFFHWHLAFPTVFGEATESFTGDDTAGWTGGFDVVLGNPPWEGIKVSEQEHFAGRNDAIARAEDAGERKKLIEALADEDPELFRLWEAAGRVTVAEREFARRAGAYPKCSGGHVNTYALFAELARRVASADGVVGIIVPTGIVTDKGTSPFAQLILDESELVSLYDFVNERPLFPSVRRHQRFSLVTLRRRGGVASIQFAFELSHPEDLKKPNRSYSLTPDTVVAINPNTRTFPIFPNRMNAAVVASLYENWPILSSEASGSPWKVEIRRMFNTTDDVEQFERASGSDLLPMFDGKMVRRWNHRAASLSFSGHQFRKIGKIAATLDDLKSPDFECEPVYWLKESAVSEKVRGWKHKWLLAFKKVSGTTSTWLSSFVIIPYSAASESFPIVYTEDGAGRHCCLAAVFNSVLIEFLLRQKMQGLHLHYYLLEQTPVPAPPAFESVPEWSSTPLIDWIAQRVLELTYTSWKLHEFAQDLGWTGCPFEWSEARRSLITAELDAAIFHLYRVPRNDVEYIFDELSKIRSADIRKWGDYRTKLEVVDIFDQMQKAIDTGQPFQTSLNPLPSDPGVAHPESTRPDWVQAIR